MDRVGIIYHSHYVAAIKDIWCFKMKSLNQKRLEREKFDLNETQREEEFELSTKPVKERLELTRKIFK